MTLSFTKHREFTAKDKHNPRRRWHVYQFKTTRGVITLCQRLRVTRVKRTVTYLCDENGRWREQSKSRKVTEMLTPD